MDTARSKIRPFLGTKSLGFKVSVVMAVIMLVALAVFSLVFETSEQQKVTADIFDTGKTFATFSADSIYSDYSQYYTHTDTADFANFKSSVGAIMASDKDIKEIQLVGVNGRILFDTSEFTSGRYTGSTYRQIADTTTLSELTTDFGVHAGHKRRQWPKSHGNRCTDRQFRPPRGIHALHFVIRLTGQPYDRRV